MQKSLTSHDFVIMHFSPLLGLPTYPTELHPHTLTPLVAPCSTLARPGTSCSLTCDQGKGARASRGRARAGSMPAVRACVRGEEVAGGRFRVIFLPVPFRS